MKKIVRRLLFYLLCVLPVVFIFPVLQVIAGCWLPVFRTPLMGIRSWEHRNDTAWKTRYNWVSLEKISPQLVQAVIASEDNRFEQHNGFDWIELDIAWNHEQRKQKRGASTITQQVAKNVFLWPQRSWLRKGLEAYYTVLIELFWSKGRIMEIYLNVVEIGKGVYGAEAAAQFYYKKPAAKLTAAEAAMLAVCLPNPLRRNPRKPTTYLLQRQKDIMNLMRKLPQPGFLNQELRTKS
ncbi:MAG: monofunctional biosynthetic peptidoglycan transglycosylase [Prevotellaceae bacterium]|jgi:monofunctional biosynthetic peptidoglycan transglycosylase|nr:monofunctional biosynthetic peptidoglycan transglycosylase [Prevotellaceae bacterium]